LSSTKNLVLDKDPPQLNSVIINSGESATDNSTINLNVSGSDNDVVMGVCIKNTNTDPKYNDPCWRNLNPVSSFSSVYVHEIDNASEIGDHLRHVYVWLIDGLKNISAVKSDSITFQVLDKITPTGGISIVTIPSDYRYSSYDRDSNKIFYKYRAEDNIGIIGKCIKYYAFVTGADYSESENPDLNDSCWETIEKTKNLNVELTSRDVDNSPYYRKIYYWFKDEAGNISIPIYSILNADLYGGYSIENPVPY